MPLLSINLLRWGLMLSLLALPTGCSSHQPTATPSPSPTAPTTATSPAKLPSTTQPRTKSPVASAPKQPYSKGEPFEYKGVTLTISRMREFQGDKTFEKPPAGKKWLALEVSADNKGDHDLVITFTQIKLADDNNKTYDQNLLALSALNTNFDTVKPGKHLMVTLPLRCLLALSSPRLSGILVLALALRTVPSLIYIRAKRFPISFRSNRRS